MLTARQRRCLEYLHAAQSAGAPCPSYGEIALHMGVATKSAVARMIDMLEARGFVRRRPRGARSLEVIRPPPGAGPDVADLVRSWDGTPAHAAALLTQAKASL